MTMNGWKPYLAGALLFLSNAAQAELIDRGNGLIYDTVLDITWLQDANYAQTSGYDDDGYMTWYEATEWADQLVYAGFSDWRLASVCVSAGTPIGTIDTASSIVNCYTESEEACRDNEYAYMFLYNLGGLIGDNLTGDQTSLSGVDLYNLQFGHWSNDEYYVFYESFVFFFGGGGLTYDAKTSHWAAWAVRDGDIDDPSCDIPAKPDQLTANVRGGTVYLSWDSSEGTTSYDVYRSLNDHEFVLIANIEQSAYADEPPDGTRLVEYYVVALNECGESIPSEILSITLKKGMAGR